MLQTGFSFDVINSRRLQTVQLNENDNIIAIIRVKINDNITVVIIWIQVI